MKKSTPSQIETESVIAEDGEAEESLKIPFPIVGIGASAGGLEAFTALLQHLPRDTGMAFVLVQHLSPSHKSMLASLLEKKSAMPVTEVTDGLSVVSDHVYVIPPNACMSISDGVLRLDPRPAGTEQNLPIDFFLCSLAEHQKNKAIAVILSGTASDGSHGVKVIKDYGGITFAQDENTAQFDMMPKNAIATGCVDFVLSPERIAKELVNLSHHPYIHHNETKEVEELVSEVDSFPQILMLLQKISGIDFRNYKSMTIKRRILRRMMLNKIENFKNYVTFLIKHPKELQALSQDVFITVTRFFRDPEIFEALKKDVFPHLVANRSSEVIRIWVLGCSTGEEVYSLAISFLEFLEGKESCPIIFFATDIKDSSIESARQGIYAESIANDVSVERLGKFFIKIDRGYQVNKSIRGMCVFARQNITTDPPFSKIDLISCRNVLIYLDAASQKRIIPIFHYALNPTGFLLLGKSESVVAFSDLFNGVNKKAKIYSKNPAQKTPQLVFSSSTRVLSGEIIASHKPTLQANSLGVADIQREADRVILKRHHHSGVVVNESMEVVQFRGDTSRYLKHLPGTASLNLLKMVQEGLFLELRNAIQKVKEENIPLKTKSIRINHNGNHTDVSLEILPFKVQPKNERYFLIAFEDLSPMALPESDSKNDTKAQEVKVPESSRQDSSIRDLEQELESMKLHLQGCIDTKEAANEELQAANEEILSTNEELQSLNEEFQSANEELESAKEELQATNEEITTLNDELQNRNTELTELNDDHINLMSSMNLPIVMVSRDFKIRSFTPMAAKVLKLIPGDVGRPISDLKSNMGLPDLENMMLHVMNTDTLKEQEVRDQKGDWYKVHIRPYKTSDNKIAGVVIAFFDVNDSKKVQEILMEYGTYREAIIQTFHQPFLVLDAALRVKMANKSFYETFQVTPEDTLDNSIYHLGNGQWNSPKIRKLFEDILPQKSVFSNYKVEHDFPSIGHKIITINARQIINEGGRKESILLSFEDITEVENIQDKLQVQANAVFREAITQTIPHPLLVLDSHLRVQFSNRAFYKIFQTSVEQTVNQSFYDLGNGQWNIPNLRTLFEEILPKHKSIDDYAIEHTFPVIGYKMMLLNARIIRSEIGKKEELILVTIEDITQRKQAENNLRDVGERFRFMAESMPHKVFTATSKGKRDYFNQQWNSYIGASFEKKSSNWTQYIHPGDKEETIRRWKHSIETGEPFEFEYRLLRVDGVYRWHLSRAYAMRDSHGNITMWIGSSTDIDDQKAVEEKIKHYAQELLRSNKDLEQFALIASHDLQEPLNIVSNYTNILKKKYNDKFDEAGRQFTGHIVESVHKMQQLIFDLLSYSKVGRERKFKEVEMGDICNQAIKNLAMMIKECGAEIACDKLPRMVVDETLMTQLFQNLISNSMKFRNPQTFPKIHILAKSEQEDWIFLVKDNGIGIAPENHAQIFEMFERLHTQNKYPGAGIGLALCKRIVEFHEGKIWVESDRGKGTIFYISFPKESSKSLENMGI